MKMQLETSELNLISHYEPGAISVNGEIYHNNILITSRSVTENWFSGEIAELTAAHFDSLFNSADPGTENSNHEEPPEIVLLGTGSDHVFPNMSILAELKTKGISVEVMNTRAACRTYSVLVGEDRSVAAALMQFDR